MNTFIDLNADAINLNEIIVKTRLSMRSAPKGSLRISKRGNSVQYYHRDDPKKQNGRYINKKNMNLAHRLAQKEYDNQVLELAHRKRELLHRFNDEYFRDNIEDVYDNLSPDIQVLVTPYILPQEEFLRQWEGRTYTGKAFVPDAPEIYTEKGERVRSKSEKIIADKLKLMNIPYLYEYPLQLKGYGTVYPDFTLLNTRTRKEFYLEHFGKMDDASYSEKTILKIKTYEKNGIFPGETLLMTYETASHPLDMKIVEEMLHKYLM